MEEDAYLVQVCVLKLINNAIKHISLKQQMLPFIRIVRLALVTNAKIKIICNNGSRRAQKVFFKVKIKKYAKYNFYSDKHIFMRHLMDFKRASEYVKNKITNNYNSK